MAADGSNGGPQKIETRLYINGKASPSSFPRQPWPSSSTSHTLTPLAVQFVESSDKKTFKLFSPSTREHVADVFEATTADTNAAVAAAKAAQPSWAALSPTERGVPMKKLAALLRTNESQTRMAALEASSMGRPLGAYFDAEHCAGSFEAFAAHGWGAQAQGATSVRTPGMLAMTLRQPFGVAAAIIPWNGPAVFFGSKVAPMVAAGNAVVLKSSEKAPLTSAYIAGLIDQAGFPPGVINVLHGHGQTSGATLSSHMDVRVLSFTGSGRTGRLICEAAARSNLKNVHLELGGKSPAIIFDDADLDRAAADTQFSMTLNSGQICMANSRILVHEAVAADFQARFRDRYAAVRVGRADDDAVQMGPLADAAQYESVTSYIQLAKDAGATMLLGGDASVNKEGGGFFVGPHIFTDLPDDSRPAREEIFGPVVIIGVFKTEEEAVRRANDTEYGLYASVYTKDISRAIRMAQALESGTVGVNCSSPTLVDDMPFGGYKASGLGREGLTHSLGNFLEEKTVLIRL
ncbi:aldehyde dehydrogenase [Diplodia corticola]|uniref:aldehyde dehydrogenase (NAD(+)) n=1 Tax=Diplodia corticola TaxID=236234 RepID=A0A1J9RSF3_9PEZI|nr:aldehyde dehydrogenase [Diplodia corticola]OJD30453.1 aldehyde dehydrogenase [Diplodia corticola]